MGSRRPCPVRRAGRRPAGRESCRSLELGQHPARDLISRGCAARRHRGRRPDPAALDGAPDDWRGIYGALQLHAAVTVAREGRDGDAWRYWDRGDQVAKNLPANYVHPSTVFGRANVDFHAVSVATDLQRAQKALGLAADLDPDTMPSRERRARLWVEVARGHLQRGDTTAALHVMQMAHRIGAEAVAYTPSARTVAAELWRGAPRSMRQEAGRLAEMVGVSTG
ncbi:hypothetical protein [Streptomyces sp. MUM 16J]|uniref:hypothetical protein n=1 Tax=Streptomyces sp. MUM 16J TaxID=2791988 RepID=UPI001F0489B1|nr:hypothetical protein [Streptomyces sp. MUM 16J]